MQKKVLPGVAVLLAFTVIILIAAWSRFVSVANGGLSQPKSSAQAREALLAYISLLHAGNYAEAANLYGGIYDLLRDWNPTVDPNDYVALFENGCTINGLMCLQMLGVVQEEQIPPDEFKFTVEFMNEDGSLFVSGPETAPQSQFTDTVRKVNGLFLIQDLPIYVP